MYDGCTVSYCMNYGKSYGVPAGNRGTRSHHNNQSRQYFVSPVRPVASLFDSSTTYVNAAKTDATKHDDVNYIIIVMPWGINTNISLSQNITHACNCKVDVGRKYAFNAESKHADGIRMSTTKCPRFLLWMSSKSWESTIDE